MGGGIVQEVCRVGVLAALANGQKKLPRELSCVIVRRSYSSTVPPHLVTCYLKIAQIESGSDSAFSALIHSY